MLIIVSQVKIVAWGWGKRNLKTAKQLRDKMMELQITYDKIYTDNRISFI